ncbi:MAG: response regulator [Acidobacteriota bacterium]|jgi:putative nucleotidyltransferase with HDIG domain|nr:response regulator [Acidobacteriota bacterium]
MAMQNTRESILIVDDEDSVRTVLMRQLEELGSECQESASAIEALEKLEARNYSLVISDVRMPGMSGMEFLRRARAQNPETSFIMITGFKDIQVAVDSLRIGACDFITKPFDLNTIRHSVDMALERRNLMIENRRHREKLEAVIRSRTAELHETLREVEASYRITLETMVSALDVREHETGAHSQRVREYAIALAKYLGLKHEGVDQVACGALLHDIGKIGVPDSILLKPGRLTDREWLEMRKHSETGYDILSGIEFLSPAADIVLCHHERWDGMGYPNRLGGADIPLGARIFAVADTVDAITSDRPYRTAKSFEDARDEIRRCSGMQFDPHVADAFLDMPVDTWVGIRDTVNGMHSESGDEGFGIPCQTSATSR